MRHRNRLAIGLLAVLPLHSAAAGTLYAFDNLADLSGGEGDALIMFDSEDPGEVTEIGHSGIALTPMTGLEFTPDGRLWAYGAALTATSQPGFYEIDPETGSATWVGPAELENGRRITDLAYNPADGMLYGPGHKLGTTPQLYTIDPGTGLATKVGDLVSDVGVVPYGLAAGADGTLYVMAAATDTTADGLYRLDGLELVPVIDLPITLVFSQGITIDWAGQFGERNTGFHGAFNESNSHCELWYFDPLDATAEYVDDIGAFDDVTGRAEHQTGDLAIRPRARRDVRRHLTPNGG